jgi:hypothetical protein
MKKTILLYLSINFFVCHQSNAEQANIKTTLNCLDCPAETVRNTLDEAQTELQVVLKKYFCG